MEWVASGMKERISGMQEYRWSGWIHACRKGFQACRKPGGASGFKHEGKGVRRVSKRSLEHTLWPRRQPTM